MLDSFINKFILLYFFLIAIVPEDKIFNGEGNSEDEEEGDATMTSLVEDDLEMDDSMSPF
jgi:hypothetical protein